MTYFYPHIYLHTAKKLFQPLKTGNIYKMKSKYKERDKKIFVNLYMTYLCKENEMTGHIKKLMIK